ncbi:MAG: nucleotidyltransferase family protein [Defluviitaleaceae bacterium]|nr:nucleotidyltransferase family protein [Defluviitaleaceae bacterium]
MQNKSIESMLAALHEMSMQALKQPLTKTVDFSTPPSLSDEIKLQSPMYTSMINILEQYPVKRAALFGSAARQEMTDASDIDMLVEFHPGTSGLDFYGLGGDLEEALGCHVDLLTWASLRNAKHDFVQNVVKDARLIYES